MSRKRTFTVHVNIDDMAAMIAGLDGNNEKAEWLDGYLVGVHGHNQRDSWTEAKRLGHEFGAKHFAEVEEFRAEQKRKSDLAEAAKAAKKNPDVTHVVPTGTGSGNPAGDPIQQSTNPLIQQPTIRNPSPLEPPKGKRFVPPTESEWVTYCGEAWKDWHPECSAEAWAYYESKGWKIGSSTCKDWRAAARTAHGNARTWGKLQPMSGTPISPPASRQEQKRPSWAIDRDLNDARKDLQHQQDARKEARDQRNRFSVGQEEHRKYSGQMADADERIREVEERIKALNAERGAANA